MNNLENDFFCFSAFEKAVPQPHDQVKTVESTVIWDSPSGDFGFTTRGTWSIFILRLAREISIEEEKLHERFDGPTSHEKRILIVWIKLERPPPQIFRTPISQSVTTAVNADGGLGKTKQPTTNFP